MELPSIFVEREGIDPKLAVGSSLTQPKELLAWTITLFLVNDCESTLEYSEGIADEKIKIEENIFNKVKLFFRSLSCFDESLFDTSLKYDNPLCKMQLEPLQVPLQIVWKLAKINYVESTSTSSKERTGGVRFAKKLEFTTNLILIKNVLMDKTGNIGISSKALLYQWITGLQVDTISEYDESIEEQLTSTLLVLTEDTLYKDWKDSENQFIFQLEGIYSNIKSDQDRLSLYKSREAKGTLRNLIAILKENLHPYLQIINYSETGTFNTIVLSSNRIEKLKYELRKLPLLKYPFVNVYTKNFGVVLLKDEKLKDEYLNYTSLVNNFHDLVPKNPMGVLNQEVTKKQAIDYDSKSFAPPYQVIFFGSPGTGKSHQVEELTKNHSNTRITFHPDSDYQSFVGGYKPVMDKDDKIKYEFVPQAFIKAYCKAWLNPNVAHYLLIEEINRGNCAQIFGDIFQCLDRDRDGYSEYTLEVSTELATYLNSELETFSPEQRELYLHKTKSGPEELERICLPPNLYIYATMNTSDQSLFPMDSAFKRRWSWKHIPINYEDADSFIIEISDNYRYAWGDFIRKINPSIRAITGSEDKLLGNRFVNPIDYKISREEFISKVMFYLWDEIYKEEYQTPNTIFKHDLIDNQLTDFSFSELFEEDSIALIESFLRVNNVNLLS